MFLMDFPRLKTPKVDSSIPFTKQIKKVKRALLLKDFRIIYIIIDGLKDIYPGEYSEKILKIRKKDVELLSKVNEKNNAKKIIEFLEKVNYDTLMYPEIVHFIITINPNFFSFIKTKNNENKIKEIEQIYNEYEKKYSKITLDILKSLEEKYDEKEFKKLFSETDFYFFPSLYVSDEEVKTIEKIELGKTQYLAKRGSYIMSYCSTHLFNLTGHIQTKTITPNITEVIMELYVHPKEITYVDPKYTTEFIPEFSWLSDIFPAEEKKEKPENESELNKAFMAVNIDGLKKFES